MEKRRAEKELPSSTLRGEVCKIELTSYGAFSTLLLSACLCDRTCESAQDTGVIHMGQYINIWAVLAFGPELATWSREPGLQRLL